MLANIFAISADIVTKLGLYVLLPIFIATLFYIMWDLSRKNDAGKAGTFWIFVALGAGFSGFLFKVVLEFVMGKWFI